MFTETNNQLTVDDFLEARTLLKGLVNMHVNV